MESNVLQKSNITPLRHVLTLLVLLGLAVAARIRVTMLDFNSLLTTYLQDDAFYYYKIAANIFNLHRITYDGEQLSNGFHPLWLILITPFYTPANDGVDFVFRVQWIMLFFALLTVVVLYLTLLRLRASWLCAAVVTAVFCVHSTFIDMQMNGLETSLNTFMLLLLFNAFLTIFENPAVVLRRYIYFGFVAAATFLTRTDNGITLLLLFVALAWVSRKHIPQCWPRLLLGGIVTLLLISPWLLWNQINFGSFIQGSGKIETILWGEPHFSLANTAISFVAMPMRLYDSMQGFAQLFISAYGGSEALAGLFLAGWIVVMLLLLINRAVSVSLCALAIFCASIFAVFCYHVGFRIFIRSWYYVPIGLMALLSVAGLVIWYCQNQSSRQPRNAISASLLLLWLVSVLWLYSPTKLHETADQVSEHMTVADWINTNTSPDAVIGSMNSGVLSYLVHRKVINLDGVVDSRSMRAHWEKRQAAYIHERGVNYLVDNDGSLQFFCSENILHTCQEVYSFGYKGNPSKVMKIVDKK